MALLTSLRESGLHVVRIGGAVEVFNMARSAIGRRSDELIVDVARGASHGGMRSGQRKLRKGVVIKSGRIPGAAVVASLAGGGESGLGVRRIVGLIEVSHVAAHTSGRSANELAAGVASIAIQGGVRAD